MSTRPKCVTAIVWGDQPLDRFGDRVPGLDVDVGRRRRHQRRRRTAGCARRRRRRRTPSRCPLVQVGDVVRGVPGRVLDAEVPRAPSRRRRRAHVLLRHRHGLAPAAQPSSPPNRRRRSPQPRRVDHVRRPALVDVDRRVGPAADERARRAGVVEVDVREHDRARGLAAERLEQRLLARTAAPGRSARRRAPSSR